MYAPVPKSGRYLRFARRAVRTEASNASENLGEIQFILQSYSFDQVLIMQHVMHSSFRTRSFAIRFGVLPLIVIFWLSATTHTVAQSPSDGQPPLSDAQKAELEKATELNNQVQALHREGKYLDAAIFADQVLEIHEKILGPEHPDTARSLNSLAALYKSHTNYAAAEPLYQRALKIREKVLGPEHPDTAGSLNNLAAMYYLQANYSAAEPLLQRALKIRAKVLGPDHPDTARSLGNLAVSFR